MRVMRTEIICILSGLLALVAANVGFAQTDSYDSSSNSAAPQAEWRQKVLRPASPAGAQSTEEMPAVVSRPTRQVSSEQWQNASAASAATAAEPKAARQWQDTSKVMTASANMPVEPRPSGRQRVVRTSAEGPEVIEPGPVQYEPMGSEGAPGAKHGAVMAEPYEGDVEGGDCESCGACGRHTDAFGYECFDGCLRCWWLRDLTLSVGVQGFKGPRDLDQNGHFGFHEGVGLSGPIGDPWGIGYEVGANFVQSDLSGTPGAANEYQDLKQTFVTFGLFRRANCCGWQGGLVYDYMHDTFDVNIDLQQLRYEISYLFCNKCELGFYGASAVDSAQLPDQSKLTATNLYTFFARRYFENCGDGRIYAGLTDYGDGLLGADLWLPLGRGFALQSGAAYVIPKQGRGEVAQERESWGLSMSLVWYPGRCAMGQQHNWYRPLFSTADNTTFMNERQLH